MAKVKRTVTEEAVVERPQTVEEAAAAEVMEPGLGEFWEHLESLTDKDIQGREFWVYQLEPPPTKKQGEPAYITVFKEKFGPDTLAQQFPHVITFKIWEKILGSNSRRIWWHQQVPRSANSGSPGLGGTSAASGQASESVMRELTASFTKSPELLQKAASQGLDIQAAAFRAALETAGKPTDLIEGLIKARAAGLLPEAAKFDWKEVRETVKDLLVFLKDQGVIGRTPEKIHYNELTEIINFVRELDGGRSDGKTSIWEQIAPRALQTLENITGNIANIANTRRPAVVPNGPAPAVAAAASGASAEPAKPPSPASTAPAPRAVTPEEARDVINTWIAARVLELYMEKDEKGEPLNDAETVGNWLGLTAPDLAALIEQAPGDAALNFLKGHPIIGKIAQDGERGVKFLEDCVKALKAGA